MEFTLFLLLGLSLVLPLSFKPNIFWRLCQIVYWLIVFIWSLKIFDFFSFQNLYWSKLLGISFSWHCDGLSYVFAMLISGIGVFIFLYAASYTKSNFLKKAKLLSLLQIFAISMLAIVVTDDMVVLFLAWELTTISSYLLIQFDVEDSKANQVAFNAMFISVLGGLMMLVGFILLHHETGSWSIQNATSFNTESSLFSIFCLIMLGVVTKSAQFPFHFWLPQAMKAPTPVSAYLHSATMVNSGLYILARFHPLFSQFNYWYPTLAFFGVTTMLLAALLSLMKSDLKAILAYTTLFALGSMVYLLASQKYQAIEAFVIFLIFHGVYKATAFMLVGVIDQRYHTRDINKLRGIAKHSYLTSFIAIICFGAMAGLPPFYGFVVKEMIYEAKLASASISYLLMLFSILSSMIIAATSIKCLFYLFYGNSVTYPDKPSTTELKYTFLLALMIIWLSMFGQNLEQMIINAVNSIVHISDTFESVYSQMATALSILTVIGGIIIFILAQLVNLRLPDIFHKINFASLFEDAFEKFLYFGRIITYFTQRKSLEQQLAIILISLILWLIIAFYTISIATYVQLSWPFTGKLTELASILLIVTAISLLLSRRVIINMITFALLGLVISAFFVLQGAPDLAMTQLLVEILSTIILAIAVRKSSSLLLVTRITTKQKMINATIALVFGAIVTIILFIVINMKFNQKLSAFFIKNSLIEAYGRNVVNVILVDFRAFDTFGEAMVILGTALAIYLMITTKLLIKKKKE